MARKANYQDVIDAPEHKIAEVLAGELHVSPWPSPVQIIVTGEIAVQLIAPFDFGDDGPGGWLFLPRPEIHLEDDIVVPDLAGWRLTTMDQLTDDPPYVEVRPDWVCEVLSPATEAIDCPLKLPIYLREGVPHAWVVDPHSHMLTCLVSGGARWEVGGRFCDDQRFRAEPFDAIEFELGALWAKVRRRSA